MTINSTPISAAPGRIGAPAKASTATLMTLRFSPPTAIATDEISSNTSSVRAIGRRPRSDRRRTLRPAIMKSAPTAIPATAMPVTAPCERSSGLNPALTSPRVCDPRSRLTPVTIAKPPCASTSNCPTSSTRLTCSGPVAVAARGLPYTLRGRGRSSDPEALNRHIAGTVGVAPASGSGAGGRDS